MAEGRISWWSCVFCLPERFEKFLSHSQRVCLSSGRVVTSVRRTASTASLSLVEARAIADRLSGLVDAHRGESDTDETESLSNDDEDDDGLAGALVPVS